MKWLHYQPISGSLRYLGDITIVATGDRQKAITSREKSTGFTLIELSIALVIIALLVGGVLVGRDLIKTAELRKQISQVNNLVLAVNAFKLRYSALPGDIRNASNFSLHTGCVLGASENYGNGNGDGQLNYNINQPSLEDRKIFCHLFNANLFSHHQYGYGPYGAGKCYNNACTAVPGGTSNILLVANAVYVGAPATSGMQNRFYIYLSNNSNINNVGLAQTPLDSSSIDQKMDDGLPTSGKTQAWSTDSAAPTAGAAASANCLNNTTTPYSYNIRYSTANQCSLGFMLSDYR